MYGTFRTVIYGYFKQFKGIINNKLYVDLYYIQKKFSSMEFIGKIRLIVVSPTLKGAAFDNNYVLA